MAIILDGNIGVTYPDVTTQNTSAVIGGKLPTTRLPVGSVLQVVQATNTSQQYSTSSTSFASLTFNVSITPTSASSKILILYSGCMYLGSGENAGFQTIYRGGTNLGGSNGLIQIQLQPDKWIMCSTVILDSPATTSSTTYTLFGRTNTTGITYFGGDSLRTTLTAMEIAG